MGISADPRSVRVYQLSSMDEVVAQMSTDPDRYHMRLLMPRLFLSLRGCTSACVRAPHARVGVRRERVSYVLHVAPNEWIVDRAPASA